MITLRRSQLKVLSSLLTDIAAGLILATLTVRDLTLLIIMLTFAIICLTIAVEAEEMIERKL